MAKQSTTRRLDLVSLPALSDEARDAVNAAFEAMSSWRTEAVENNEKSLEQVVEKMAVAARALEYERTGRVWSSQAAGSATQG